MKQSNLSFATLYLLITLSTTLTFGQQNDSLHLDYLNKNSLQFHLLNGVGLSYLAPISEFSNLRYSLDVNISFSDREVDQHRFYNPIGEEPVTDGRDTEYDQSNVNLSFTLYYLYNVYNSNNIKMYTGVGPSLNYYYSYSKSQESGKESEYFSKSDNTEKGFGYGATMVLGVEAFILENFSIIGEYRLSVFYKSLSGEINMYSQSSQSYETRTKYKSEISEWDLRFNTVKIGFAVYL